MQFYSHFFHAKLREFYDGVPLFFSYYLLAKGLFITVLTVFLIKIKVYLVNPNSITEFPDILNYSGIWFVLELKVPECIKIH